MRSEGRKARPTFGRWMVVGIGTIVLAALAGAQGLSAVAYRSNPKLALRLTPTSGRALNRLVEQQTRAISPDRYRQLVPLAQRALRRQPLSIGSIRLLYLVAATKGDASGSDRLLDLAEQLSRRDLTTQLLLIERAVSRGDVEAALHHYDVALRTNQSAFPILFPILTQALRHQSFVGPMTRLARMDPNWFLFFAGEAVTADAALPNLAKILIRSPGTKAAQDGNLRQNLLDRLVASNETTVAREYYRTLNPTAIGLVLDPAFAKPDWQPPFGWNLASDTDLGAERVRGEGLHFFASAQRSGAVATQLLLLPPGRYELQSRLVQGRTADIVWRLRCQGRDTDLLISSAVEPRRAGYMYRVPEGCTHQTLTLEVNGAGGPDGIDGTVSKIAMRRL